jgi:hypothetical protein
LVIKFPKPGFSQEEPGFIFSVMKLQAGASCTPEQAAQKALRFAKHGPPRSSGNSFTMAHFNFRNHHLCWRGPKRLCR